MMAKAILQGLGMDASKCSGEATPLLANVTEKNKAYFHRWREIQIPAMLAGTLDTTEVRSQLADADNHIGKLEVEIDRLRHQSRSDSNPKK
jgi:hypothetical protein